MFNLFGDVFGRFGGGFWQVWGRFGEAWERLAGMCLGHVWGPVWDVFSKFAGHLLEARNNQHAYDINSHDFLPVPIHY